MRTWLKKLGKALAWLVAGLVLLLGLALLFLQTGPGKSVLRSQLLPRVDKALAGQLSVERIEGNLLTSVELHGVVLEDARGNVAARIPAVYAEWSPLQLLDDELRIDSLRIEQPLVFARIYEDGTFNLSTVAKDQPEKKEPPSQFQVTLPDIGLSDGLFVYLDQREAGRNLSKQQRADLGAWFDALDEEPVSVAELREQIAQILDGRPTQTLSVASAGGIDLKGAYHLYGSGQMSARIERLEADIHSDATAGAQPLVVDQLRALRSAEHVEARWKELGLGSLASTRDVSAAVTFETREDELGNQVVVSVDQYVADVGQARVDNRVFELVAPSVPLTGPATASAKVAGTPTDLVYLVRVGCGQKPAATLAGTASFAEEGMASTTYEVSALFDELRPHECVDTGGTTANLTGALHGAGQGVDPQRLEARAEMALSDSQVADYQIEALYLNAEADQGQFTITELDALTPYAGAKLSAQMNMEGDYKVSLQLEANDQVGRLVEKLGDKQLASKYAHIDLERKGSDGDNEREIQ